MTEIGGENRRSTEEVYQRQARSCQIGDMERSHKDGPSNIAIIYIVSTIVSTLLCISSFLFSHCQMFAFKKHEATEILEQLASNLPKLCRARFNFKINRVSTLPS